MQLNPCQHPQRRSNHCLACGVFIAPFSKVSGLKTLRFVEQAQPEFTRIRKNTKCQSLNFTRHLKPPSRFLLSRITYYVQKLGLSPHTQALASYCLALQLEHRSCQESIHKQNLVAAIILYLCAKLIQRNCLIPSMASFRKIVCLDTPLDEYHVVQKQLFHRVINNSFSGLFTEHLGIYLASGAIFMGEIIGPTATYEQIVSSFEDRVINQQNNYVRTGKFLEYDQHDLALLILYKYRLQSSLGSAWSRPLEELTGVQARDMHINWSRENDKNSTVENRNISNIGPTSLSSNKLLESWKSQKLLCAVDTESTLASHGMLSLSSQLDIKPNTQSFDWASTSVNILGVR